MNTGWSMRLAILRQRAEEKILSPLRTHGWSAEIELETEQGEYLIVRSERAGVTHRVALMYSTATDNSVYRGLEGRVEQIFVNGELYKLDAYAYGVKIAVSTADDFHGVLVQWNTEGVAGKFAPPPLTPIVARPPTHRTLLAEAPIDAIWLRLRQLTSVTLAQRLIASRAQAVGSALTDDVLRSKAQGVAFSLRNAADYFRIRDGQNVSQRVLSLYYGAMSFAFAEMLASPHGPKTLDEIENATKQGHGLATLDGEKDGLENIVVTLVASGFYSTWLKFIGVEPMVPSKKPKAYVDLAKQDRSSWLTVEELFARIPEVSDLFLDIFSSKPSWVAPAYDKHGNPPISRRIGVASAATTYAILVDGSGRLTPEDIARFPGPITQIVEVPSAQSGRQFRVAVDSSGKELWSDALPLHHSPFERKALIAPAFGVVNEYRAICFALLYALSIVVRYRPSVWRRVQEGELDHLRVLIEAFLAVVERVLPEQFLVSTTGQQVFAKQPGALW